MFRLRSGLGGARAVVLPRQMGVGLLVLNSSLSHLLVPSSRVQFEVLDHCRRQRTIRCYPISIDSLLGARAFTGLDEGVRPKVALDVGSDDFASDAIARNKPLLFRIRHIYAVQCDQEGKRALMSVPRRPKQRNARATRSISTAER